MRHRPAAIALRRPTFAWLLAGGILLLAGVVVTMASAAMAAPLATVVLRDRAQVDGSVVRLGQVAQIRAYDPQLARRLERIVVAQAPPVAAPLWLDRRVVVQRLRQRGIDTNAVKVMATRAVKVTAKGQRVPVAAIQAAIRRHVLSRLSAGNAQVQVTFPSRQEPVLVPDGAVSLKVDPPAGDSYRGRVVLAVQVGVDGKPVRRIRVPVNVRLLAKAVVTTRPLGKRQPVEPDMVTVRTVDITRAGTDVLTDPSHAVGQRTTVSLLPGTVLKQSMLEPVPVVRRGDVVRMVAEKGPLRIVTQGVCRQPGAPGQRIVVVNMRSKKEVVARVVDAGTVKVVF